MFQNGPVTRIQNLYVGHVSSAQKCAMQVQAMEPAANGVSVYNGTKCFAEFGLARLGGVAVTHTTHPDAGNNGQYFYFDPSAWMAMLGASSVGGEHHIYQYRGSELVWNGTVVVWNNANGVHGQRAQGAGANQFQPEDVLTIWGPTSVLQDIGPSTFNELFAQSNNGIIKRICHGCEPMYRSIFYRRLDDEPGFALYDYLFNHWNTTNNVLHSDFELFSSYGDALAGVNAWAVCDFYFSSFPQGCKPTIDSSGPQFYGPPPVVEFYIEGAGEPVQNAGVIDLNNSAVMCTTPNATGPIVTVSTKIGPSDWLSSSRDFVYHNELELVEPAEPLSGPSYGNTIVSVETDWVGTADGHWRVISAVVCDFGGALVPGILPALPLAPAPGSFQAFAPPGNTTRLVIECTSPSNISAGAVNLRVSTNGQQFTASQIFVVHEPSLILDVTPPSWMLPVNYTTDTLSVYASNLYASNSTFCRFIDVAGSEQIYAIGTVSNTHVVCNWPNVMQPTNYSLAITLNGQQFSTNNIYVQTYNPRHMSGMLQELTPCTVLSSACTIFVNGSWPEVDQAGIYVEFAGVNNGIVYAQGTPGGALAQVPPHNFSDVVNLAVSFNGVHFLPAGEFRYLPLISAVSPFSTLVYGGMELTLTGAGFAQYHEEIRCSFGGDSNWTVARYLSYSKVECPSYAWGGIADSVSVSVSVDNGVHYSVTSANLVYYSNPSVTAVAPSSVAFANNVQITFIE